MEKHDDSRQLKTDIKSTPKYFYFIKTFNVITSITMSGNLPDFLRLDTLNHIIVELEWFNLILLVTIHYWINTSWEFITVPVSTGAGPLQISAVSSAYCSSRPWEICSGKLKDNNAPRYSLGEYHPSCIADLNTNPNL